VPIGLAVEGANRHDMKLVRETIENIGVKRPEKQKSILRSCAWTQDMTIKKCEISCWSLGLLPIFAYAGKRQKIAREAGQRARRWVVERTHSWLNRFRRILVRWEKKAEN
jgi:putative transposase